MKKIKNFRDFVIKKSKKLLNVVTALMAKASTDYRTKVAECNLQAQANLAQYQRMAMKAPPIVPLNPAQEETFLFPEYRGQGAYIQLDYKQSLDVTYHMIRQLSMDAQSSKELVEAIAPLVGIPTLLEPLYKAHEFIGQNLILPYINHGKTEEFKITYSDMVGDPLYEGIPRGIKMRYNLHSDKCKKFCAEYKKSKQHVPRLQSELRAAGIELTDVRANGIYLEVYLKCHN